LSSLARRRLGRGVTIVTATASAARSRYRPRATCSIIESADRCGAQVVRDRADAPVTALFAGVRMNARIKQLRDLVVALDRADRNQQPLDPDTYRAAAKAAFTLTKQEMGLLPMADFAGPVNALQNMAENIYFGINGCFADLDGSGRAPVAASAAKALLGRLSAQKSQDVRQICDELYDRLRTPKAKGERGRNTAGTNG
jgi:hypothetical protein